MVSRSCKHAAAFYIIRILFWSDDGWIDYKDDFFEAGYNCVYPVSLEDIS
jgi:hypothetical protein